MASSITAHTATQEDRINRMPRKRDCHAHSFGASEEPNSGALPDSRLLRGRSGADRALPATVYGETKGHRSHVREALLLWAYWSSFAGRRMSGRAPLGAWPCRGPRLDQRLPDVPS